MYFVIVLILLLLLCFLKKSPEHFWQKPNCLRRNMSYDLRGEAVILDDNCIHNKRMEIII